MTISDRSPLSDFWYLAIFAEMEVAGSGTSMLDDLLRHRFMKDICSRYPTLFLILPPQQEVYEAVLAKMISRENGLDVMELHYVETQNLIFSYLQNYAGDYPFRFLLMEKEDLYTSAAVAKMVGAIEAMKGEFYP